MTTDPVTFRDIEDAVEAIAALGPVPTRARTSASGFARLRALIAAEPAGAHTAAPPYASVPIIVDSDVAPFVVELDMTDGTTRVFDLTPGWVR